MEKRSVWVALAAAAAVLIGWAAPVSAQAVVNPRLVEFSPSADHSTILPDGQAAVTDYLLEVYQLGATSPYQAFSIGKPTPDPDGLIRYDFSSQAVGWAAGVAYEARVAAEGPTGTGESDWSNTFIIEVPGSCTFAVAPTAVSATSSGGTPTVTETTQAGCVWTATSGVTWIAPSPSTGNDTATIALNIAPNTGAAARTGTVTVAGQTVTVTQAATPPSCSYSVTPTAVSQGSTAGTATVTVTAGSGCTWTAASGAGWIGVSPASSSGNGSVTLTLAENTANTSRTGTVSVAGQAVTVTQAGAAAATCTYAVSPTSVSLTARSGTYSVALTAQTGCAWRTASSAGWLTVTTRRGSGSWAIAFRVSANNGRASRTATFTVGGQVVTVTQARR